MLSAEGEGWHLSVRGGGGHDLLTISPVCGGIAAQTRLLLE